MQCGFRILNTELENTVYSGEESQFGQIETSLSSAALYGELMWKCKNVIFFLCCVTQENTGNSLSASNSRSRTFQFLLMT